MAQNEEYIENLEQLDDYYGGNYDWDEILENFKLTESFIRANFTKLDKTLLLQNQELSLSFIFDFIKDFDLDELIEIKEIKDIDLINKLKELKHKDVSVKQDFIVKPKESIEDVNSFTFDEDDSALVRKENIIEETIKDSIIKTKVDVEQLSIDKLRELHVPYNSIIGIHLSKVYITKYKELENKYKNSIKNFDDLILESLNAK